jgi:hypothetical protein
MSKIVYGPWAEQNKEVELLRDQFGEVAQAFLDPINEAQQELQAAYTPFKERGNIRPVHCRTAINSLNRTSLHIQEFCTFLREAACLPVIIVAIRYQLLALLRHIEEQSLLLLDLIDEHRESCLTPSQHVLQQSREISTIFETLLQHLAAISQQLLLLNDEAQFQERRLILMFEEHAYPVVTCNGYLAHPFAK